MPNKASPLGLNLRRKLALHFLPNFNKQYGQHGNLLPIFRINGRDYPVDDHLFLELQGQDYTLTVLNLGRSCHCVPNLKTRP